MDSRCDTMWNYTLDPTGALIELYSKFDTVAIGILMPLLMFFGIIGNLAFLLMLCRVPKMRSLTNFYLANLAISDIAFLVFAVSTKLYDFCIGKVNFSPTTKGVFECLFRQLVVDVSYFASLFVISLVSLEKYYAICKPIRHRVISSWDRTVKLIACSWVVSVLIAISVIPSYSVIEYMCFVWPEEEQYADLLSVYTWCVATGHLAASYANALQTVPFFIAFILNTTMYVLIVRRLSQRADQPIGQQEAVPVPDQAIHTRNQVAKMLVINGSVFFLLLAPFEIVSIVISAYALEYEQELLILQICRLLSYLNSVINPFLFGMVNSRYRDAYKQAFLPARGNRVGAAPAPVPGLPAAEQPISQPSVATCNNKHGDQSTSQQAQ
ncbi:allatostatin-A receptor-like [Patiria miniata]|uniref:G-protein coupled receptors family 1 profile domain-containing protein n=1 Tax=Patiria miniata TaxID=46514 RepID=A0A913ZU81_PATMI|nr:allatostatin-A receptor-like [Patiria miniata]